MAPSSPAAAIEEVSSYHDRAGAERLRKSIHRLSEVYLG